MLKYIENADVRGEVKTMRGGNDIAENKDCITYNGYYANSIQNMTGINYNTDMVWYSFHDNKKHFNFHIAPHLQDDAYINLIKPYYKKIEEECNERGIYLSSKQGTLSWTKNHKWMEVSIGGFVYMLAFQSLYCDKNKKIDVDFGKIQFHAFSSNYLGPNFDKNGEFKMMYPSKESFEKLDEETCHCVQNTNYIIKNIESDEKNKSDNDIQSLVKDFLTFIALNLKLRAKKYNDIANQIQNNRTIT